MSSGEEEPNDEGHSQGQESKKRRIQRACDICRRKKIRCDGGQMPNNRCSNCIAYNFECTYVEAAKKRGPPKGYVESLENRLEKMQKLLQTLSPNTDFTQELGAQFDRDSWHTERRQSDRGCGSSSRASRQPSPIRRLTTSATPTTNIPVPVDPDDLYPSDDELGHLTLTEGLKQLAVEPLDRRFHGKSSGVMLVQAAMNLKREVSGNDGSGDLLLPPNRRKEFWAPYPWERIAEERIMDFRYPPSDLLPRLVDSFFVNQNPFLPILHRPSFERALKDQRQYIDTSFGSVVLLVCAVASRWVDDPRVYLEGGHKHSAGWKWFDQVQTYRKSLLGPPRLYDLQIYALSSIYLHGSSSPQSSWTMVGIGIRLAQDVGAHRRKVYDAPLSVESELWKRAFWVLISLDRVGSAALGRPCAIQDEDFDLDMPLEVDDEYWEHPDPEQAFKQPANKPSAIAYFNSHLKLNQIIAFALRTIYSINKSKILSGFVGPQWEQSIVAELDSALNKWIDTVPDHLRWDPHREDFLHFRQSAMLYTSYYHLQILIHRPFIPSPRKPSPLTFPSLAICTNAARSCSHVADIQLKRGYDALPMIQMAVFTAGIVLLLNIWGSKNSGMNIDPVKQMTDVHKCMRILNRVEMRFQSAGRLWDILHELAAVGDLPLPKRSPLSSNKRERGTDSPISSASSPSTSTDASSPIISASPRPIAGRRGLAASIFNFDNHSPPSSVPTPPVLPNDTPPFVSNPHPRKDMQFPHARSRSEVSSPIYSSSSTSASHPDLQNPSQLQTFGGTNFNMFDLFQSHPELLTMPLDENNYRDALGQQSVVPSTNSYLDPNFSQLPPNGFVPQAGTDPNLMNNEALQMWSTVPTSFDLEDWGSYLHNVSGTGQTYLSVDGQQQRSTQNINR